MSHRPNRLFPQLPKLSPSEHRGQRLSEKDQESKVGLAFFVAVLCSIWFVICVQAPHPPLPQKPAHQLQLLHVCITI